MHIIDKSDRYEYMLKIQMTVLYMGFGLNMDFEYIVEEITVKTSSRYRQLMFNFLIKLDKKLNFNFIVQ